ncbi:hypothetical protein CHS0354_041609 [Potamilus streckersoni]|uniref:Uncharacterized protein n=1 Tax=Potamilus streckersoni TaxID=2493646 RepID=A0AAE0SGM0_9BIVA|nr:hypothetical protein CHS0354_041609 [Potamilus streckersoni]
MSFHSSKYNLFRFVTVLLITPSPSDPIVSNFNYVDGTNNSYIHSAYCLIHNPENWSRPDIHIQFNVTAIDFVCDNVDYKFSPNGSEICARFKSSITTFLSRIDFTVTSPFPAVGGSCTGVKDCQGIGAWDTTEISATSSQQPPGASDMTSSADTEQGTTSVLLTTLEEVQPSTLKTLCFCSCQEMLPSSRLQTENATWSVTSANMTVDKRSTSKWIRTKISAEDSRTSSLSIGCVAVLILVVAAGCIVLPDMVNLLRLMWKKYG